MFPTERIVVGGINVTEPSTILVGSSSVERKSFSESGAIGASGINILENNITKKGGGEIGVKMGSLRGQDKITNSINEEQLSKAREVSIFSKRAWPTNVSSNSWESKMSVIGLQGSQKLAYFFSPGPRMPPGLASVTMI